MPEYLNEASQEKISTFHQLPSEPFWQAWQRFDGYQRECPHHDYIDDELLAFFYNGVTRYYQYELDAAGFWDFCAEEDFQGAYRLIDNMAFRHQEQAPPPQYQNLTPQPSKSVTNLEDLQAMFLEAEKTMKKMQEEFVAMRGYSESKHTPVRMVGIQMDEVAEVAESQQGTLPMCRIVEDEMEKMESEPAVLGAAFAEEINLQPLTEHAELEEEVEAVDSKEVIEGPPPVATIQTTLVVQEEVMTISCKTLSIVEVIQPPPVVDERVIRKCGSTLRNKLATSFGDSTRLELSVKFEKTTFATSYYDSGSSLNWMTYATARSLGFTSKHFKDTELSLEFADQSETLALGILKGLAVTVDNINLRADFAVLDLGEEFDNTIILGEPFEWVVRFIISVQEEDTDLHLGDNTTTSQEETEMRANELDTVGSESTEEINLPPLPERVATIEEDLGAAESEEATLDFVEEPSTVDAVHTPPAEQEEMTTLDEDTLQSQEVHELENAPHSELCMETEDMSLAETCHDSFSAETEDFSLTETEDISLTKNQTEHGFYAEKIIESAAMPRKGPDKPEDHTVSQFDKVVHNDIGDSLANRWSMSKKGNGFPWDDGISKELKLPLLFDHKSRGCLFKDGGTPAGIPRTGPDILSFNEFDQSQFLRFAGEGGCITYCDVIGSVTRPPEVLLNVPVLC